MTTYINTFLERAASQVGVTEVPWGSNDGPRVRVFQAVTRAFRAPWCASFVQWCLLTAGVGTIANDSAGVFYIVGWCRRAGWIVSTPAPGDLVAFLDGQGHIGIIESAAGNLIHTIEGNENNSVTRRTRSRYGNQAFIRVPSIVPAPKTRLLPRFELVTSSNGTGRVVVPWGKWSVVGPRIPKALVRFRSARVLRKVVKVTS